jgi:hypothetical protein
MQIIINRIALLRRSENTNIKWTVAIILGLVNISVFCIWIPARLQVSKTFININEIWDRIEKGIFCVVDCSLNYYFVRLIRTKLIANGLTKYTSLFRFNLFMIAFSMSLDVSFYETSTITGIEISSKLIILIGYITWQYVVGEWVHVSPLYIQILSCEPCSPFQL